MNTVGNIAFGDSFVLIVVHSEDEHHWQFLGEVCSDLDDAAIISLGALVDKDSTLLEIADLPPGWTARRDAQGSPWVREASGECAKAIFRPRQLTLCA